MDHDNEILNEREHTHGDFRCTASAAQKLKLTARCYPNYLDMPDVNRESLDMIFTKISRLLSGNHSEVDTWDDIAGYATLAAETLRGHHEN